MRNILISASLALVAACSPAMAQESEAPPPLCIPYGDMQEFLGGGYGESPQVFGFNGVAVMEIWANPETGTWSFTFTNPETLIACLLAVGGNYEYLGQAPAPVGEEI